MEGLVSSSRLPQYGPSPEPGRVETSVHFSGKGEGTPLLPNSGANLTITPQPPFRMRNVVAPTFPNFLSINLEYPR
jgi:hypothetical protein